MRFFKTTHSIDPPSTTAQTLIILNRKRGRDCISISFSIWVLKGKALLSSIVLIHTDMLPSLYRVVWGFLFNPNSDRLTTIHPSLLFLDVGCTMSPLPLRNKVRIIDDESDDDDFILSDLLDKPFHSKEEKKKARMARWKLYYGKKNPFSQSRSKKGRTVRKMKRLRKKQVCLCEKHQC